MLEEQLKDKIYYKMFINEHESIHPIQVLGEAFQEEAQKDLPDLSKIRFAQGEVYFHHKDFEAAIFKWENIVNELEPWAKKNTADAYYELGLLSMAEDLYTAIETEDPVLKPEVALKLLSLYIKRGKQDAAVAVIKKTVASYPDYPNVTRIAREFFEQREDWGNAVELAVNEATRTELLGWFDILHTYVEKGVTKSFAPSYFSHLLFTLFHIDQHKFEQLVSSLWSSYHEGEVYFSWLKEVNQLLLNLEIDRNGQWTDLSELHKLTYFHFLHSGWFIKQLQEYVPDLLTNWLRLADAKHVVLSAAAVLSWNELFPASISMVIVKEAEKLISVTESEINELEECLTLFEAINNWSRVNEMGENNRIRWMVDQVIDFDTRHLFVMGLPGSGKSTFINSVLGEPLQDSPTPSVVLFKHAGDLEISEITDSGIAKLNGFADFQERMDRLRNAQESIIEFRQPSPFLQEYSLAIMDTPSLKGHHDDRYGILKYVQVADVILFVLDANAPFTEKERGALAQILELAPDIPIHFLLSKMDTIANEQETMRILDETRMLIHAILPDSKVLPFSSQYDRTRQMSDINPLLQALKNSRNMEDKRLAKLLYFIRTTIAGQLQKRIDMENLLADTIRWNEEMYLKLNGAVNQLHDTVPQKAKAVSKSYAAIKEEIHLEIAEAVPKMLKECAALVKEDSNFTTILQELNDEMNSRVQDYLEQLMPKYDRLLQGLTSSCKEEFAQGQEYLTELGEGFNGMYGKERLKLTCDVKVLDDWRRDIGRLTSGCKLDPINILLRRTPTQFLLKSAGKLLGALSQNKTILYTKYKSFVENEDYTETASAVSSQFFRPFELLEKSFERDVSLFFKDPLNVLTGAVEEARSEIETNKETLHKLTANPELFRDPLTLFEVRLRQLEWMTVAGKGMQTIY